MFITRQPYHQKRNYKFSNTLAGKIYNNVRFLSSCSYLETDFNLITKTSEQNKIIDPRKIFRHQQLTYPVTKNSRRTQQIHSVLDYRLDKRNKYTNTLHSVRRNSVTTDQKTQQQVSKVNFLSEVESKRTSLLETTLTMAKQLVNNKKSLRRKALKRKLAFNPNVDAFYSPHIMIRIIDKIKNMKDIEDKSIKINFEQIYKKLIKTQLMGQFTANFMQTIQRYIHQIIERDEMYVNPFEIELQSELKNMSRKQQFLQKLIQLWNDSDTLKIHQLIKFYCIPSIQASEKILKQLIHDITIQIYQKKSCNRSIQYTLLTQEGIQITHISQIYFSTLLLLLAPKETALREYHLYSNLIEQHDKSLKMTMRQSIKHNFIEKIVNNLIDDKIINYQQNPQQYNEQRKDSINHAAYLIESKSKLKLNSKKQKGNGIPFDHFLQNQESLQNTLFTNYMLRKQRQKKQYSQVLQKLRTILDPNHVYFIKKREDESTQEEFRRLHPFNDKYDITFNYIKGNSNKILIINMVDNCTIFKSKNCERLEKLLNMIQSVYGKGKDRIKQLTYSQFKQIYQTAHGVAHRDIIMKLVLSYFNFDQFGQMSKQSFFSALDICLSQSERPRKIIKQIIWTLFKKMGLIVNKYLSKRNLSIWYEPIKIIYLLLTSIIFGGEYVSIQQMINDIIKYYD